MPNFIEDFWRDNAALWNHRLVTRFPPEPNGYSHIGHAKSELLNFGMAARHGGICRLRMDDTNPEKESGHYAQNIIEMAQWLGFSWEGEVRYASDHFDALYLAAISLIGRGLAYMDFTRREDMREMRGTLTSPGIRSDDARHGVKWHKVMFMRMAKGDFAEGECCLRAKIDMASPNINLRDPVLYRIKKVPHDRTGYRWIIYPSYDYAHPFCDGMEGVSLSLCTLEFEDHRPFYNWVISHCVESFKDSGASHPPVELEFARLELDRGLTSKRKINALVEAGAVDGWDDPRLVTLAALRRRGFTPSSLLSFCEAAGISKSNSLIPFSRIEDFLRLDLDDKAVRRVVVSNPIHLQFVDNPGRRVLSIANHPRKPEMGERPFEVSSNFWIDSGDVRAAGTAENGFKRIEPGVCFRIMPGVTGECLDVLTGDGGKVTGVVARVSNGKPRCTVHGLSQSHCTPVEIWEPVAMSDGDDPDGCLIVRHGFVEPDGMHTEGTWQAVRYGYCTQDRNHPGRLILTTPLRSGI